MHQRHLTGQPPRIFASAAAAPNFIIGKLSMSSTFHYRAFISYCHQDRKAAAKLQAAIEKFRPPPQAVASGRVPAHLRPIFRDREVLGSGHDLSSVICEALENSQALVVVCSPCAAASRWVAAEIRHFIDLRGAENVFCFVIDGEPNAADPSRECLPEPLRHVQSGREVLAADARANADGWRDAVVKTVAGLTGLSFAELARREQTRLRRRALAWAATGLLLAAIFGALALYSAQQAKAARKSAKSAELIAGYLEEVLSQFSPREDDNAARAALLPLIDASTSPDRLSRLETEPMALLRVRQILGAAYLELNSADRALPLMEKNAALADKLLGPDHPRTLSIKSALGNALNATGQHERGAEMHRRLLDDAIRIHGEKSEDALAAMTNLAISMAAAGRNDEVSALRTRVYEVGRSFLPGDHIRFQNARRNYAIVIWEQGKLDQAFVLLEELRRDQIKALGPGHLNTLETEGLLGVLSERIGNLERAAEVYASAAEGLSRIHGPDDSRAVFCAFRLVNVLAELGRPGEAAAAAKQFFGQPPDERKLGIIEKKPSDLPQGIPPQKTKR
jgi:hypothetical protein